MLAFALGFAIFSYILFAVGLLGFFNTYLYVLVTFSGAIFIIFLLYHYKATAVFLRYLTFFLKGKSVFSVVLAALIVAGLCLSFIIALAPERAFDALWYHLTIPKLYVESERIFYIPGSLLYYSAMPKLADLFFVIPIAWNIDVATRLMNVSFGVLTLIVVLQFSSKLVKKEYILLPCVLLISNYVFLWQMTTAYVDMPRTFFEILSLFALFRWIKTGKQVFFIESALCMGTAMAIKFNALFSLFALCILLFNYSFEKYKLQEAIRKTLLFALFSALVPLPWFIFSYINTGNPFFPVFSDMLPGALDFSIIHPAHFASVIINIFTSSADPISPVYLLVMPLVPFIFSKLGRVERLFLLYILISYILWYLSPINGGARYLMAYLPIVSILTVVIIQQVSSVVVKRYLILIILCIAFFSIAYRGMAAIRVLPVVFGFESKQEYLSRNLNFSYGDIYDIDGGIGRIVGENDVVLVYGVHNLYYLDFPYIHETWVKKGDIFNFILTQHAEIPEEFWNFRMVYENEVTGVKLYSGGGFWTY